MEETQARQTTADYYRAWVEAIKRRDPDAWTDLVDAYGKRLRSDIHHSLSKRGLPPEFVEDIEQETWMRALRCIDGFVWVDDETFYHWLRKIAYYLSFETRRSFERTVSIDDMENDNSDYTMDAFVARYSLYSGGVEDEAEMREFMRAVELSLRQFKPYEQEMFLRRCMGEKPADLAADYKKRPEDISQILRRVKQKVKANLQLLQSLNTRGHLDD